MSHLSKTFFVAEGTQKTLPGAQHAKRRKLLGRKISTKICTHRFHVMAVLKCPFCPKNVYLEDVLQNIEQKMHNVSTRQEDVKSCIISKSCIWPSKGKIQNLEFVTFARKDLKVMFC